MTRWIETVAFTPRKRLSVERGDNGATEINSTLPVDTGFTSLPSSRPIGVLHRANTGLQWGGQWIPINGAILQ